MAIERISARLVFLSIRVYVVYEDVASVASRRSGDRLGIPFIYSSICPIQNPHILISISILPQRRI